MKQSDNGLSGNGGVPRQGEDNRGGQPPRDLRDRTPENVQARHEAGAQAGRRRGVRGRAQGGLLQVEEQPQEDQEASDQEVVLCAFQGVWPWVIGKSENLNLDAAIWCNLNLAARAN